MDNHTQLASKITRVLFFTMSASTAGVIAASTVGPIVGANLSSSPSLAGAPAAAFLLGLAFGALGWGALMARTGRRPGMILGLVVGAAGAATSAVAIIIHQFGMFLLGLWLLGNGQASVQLGRFVAAEVHPPQERGRAISNVVLGGTVGSILGPLLVGPLGRWSATSGFDELAGPFIGTLLFFGLALILVFIWLRPEPRELAKQIDRLYPSEGSATQASRSFLTILKEPSVAVAIATMVTAQVVMVMLMVMTALHMRDHQHGLGQVSMVISSHTFGMYAFSIISGKLADRWGRVPVILTGCGTLLLANLAATLSPDVLPLAVALFLLGLGWNFCFVGGSSLLADQLAPAERARIQGTNDLLVALASASGSLGSGLIYALLGFNGIAFLGSSFALAMLITVVSWQIRRKRTPVRPYSASVD